MYEKKRKEKQTINNNNNRKKKKKKKKKHTHTHTKKGHVMGKPLDSQWLSTKKDRKTGQNRQTDRQRHRHLMQILKRSYAPSETLR